jgi:hypothetical protein
MLEEGEMDLSCFVLIPPIIIPKPNPPIKNVMAEESA